MRVIRECRVNGLTEWLDLKWKLHKLMDFFQKNNTHINHQQSIDRGIVNIKPLKNRIK